MIRRVSRLFSRQFLVVLTLALGIGATTAMFGVVDTLLWRPLPYPNADRLADVMTLQPATGRLATGLTDPSLRALRDQTQWIAAVETYQMWSGVLAGDGAGAGAAEATLTSVPRVSPGLLRLLGVTPRLGRLFDDDDDTSPAAHVAVISERLWRSRFGGADTVLGQHLTIDDEVDAIVGVLPDAFRFPEHCDIWRPIVRPSQPQAQATRVSRYQTVIALRPGVTRDAVNAQLRTIAPQMQQAGILPRDRVLVLDDLLQRRYPRRYSTAFFLMLGAVSLLLAVAMVNVTNLLLVRAAARTGEYALLGALGATRWDLVRQMALESLALALVALAGGVIVANACLALLLRLIPPQMIFLSDIATTTWDWRVMTFCGVISIATCVAASVLPALRVSRLDLIAAINNRSGTIVGGSGGAGDERWQSVLIVAQLAIVLVLLGGAGVLVRSFVRLVNVDAGLDARNLLVFDIQLPDTRYTTPGAALTLFQRLDALIEATPGVTHATFAESAPPLPGRVSLAHPEVEGASAPQLSQLPLPRRQIAPDYFDTAGIALRAGRAFRADDPDTVAIISRSLSQRLFGNEAEAANETATPMGRRIRFDPKEPWLTVIGVASDVAPMMADAPDAEPLDLYLPHRAADPARIFSVMVRTRDEQDAAAVVQQVKTQLQSLDARLPILETQTMDQRFAESMARPRLFVALAAVFATLSVVLAGVGVYGTAAYWVARRRREIGIRIALGAKPATVRHLILARGLRLAATGGAIGLAAALAARRLLDALLFVTDTGNPMTLIAVTELLVSLVLLACYLPARRASRTDPSMVLRGD